MATLRAELLMILAAMARDSDDLEDKERRHGLGTSGTTRLNELRFWRTRLTEALDSTDG